MPNIPEGIVCWRGGEDQRDRVLQRGGGTEGSCVGGGGGIEGSCVGGGEEQRDRVLEGEEDQRDRVLQRGGGTEGSCVGGGRNRGIVC